MNATAPKCPCGCGASMANWANAAAHLRGGVRRVYRPEHGSCHYCGQSLDQYRTCADCGTQDAVTAGWRPRESARVERREKAEPAQEGERDPWACDW